MKSALGQVPLISMTVLDHTNDQGDGTVTCSMPSGVYQVPNPTGGMMPYTGQAVVSIDPNGTRGYRVEGTNGPYERAVLDGTLAHYCADGITVHSFPFALKVPNT